MRRLLLACALLAAACGEQGARPLPRVDTSSMETAVAELIESRYLALEGAPDSAAAWGRYGVALHGHDLWDTAITCYERAHELDPTNFDYPYLLAYAREQRGRDVDRTLEYLELARSIDATYPPFHVMAGWILTRAGRLEEARDALETALDLAPDYLMAHANLGEVLLLLDQPRAAIEHLEAALRGEPDDRSVHAAMARALTLVGEPERAREFAERVPELQLRISTGDSVAEQVQKINRSAELSLERAKQLAEVGEWEEAVSCLRIALEERGGEAAVQSRMGHALMMLGRLEEARPYLERAVEMRPEHVVARVRLARVHAAAGRKEAAKEELDETLRMAPSFGEALTFRGILHLDDNDLASAEEMFRMAQQSPQGVTGEGYRRWGLALAQASRVPEAAVAFEAFVAQQPERADGRYMLAVAYEQTGQAEKAARQYGLALELDPDHALAPRARALLQGR